MINRDKFVELNRRIRKEFMPRGIQLAQEAVEALGLISPDISEVKDNFNSYLMNLKHQNSHPITMSLDIHNLLK